MAEHNHTGKRGEQEAAAYLVRKGYTILETNWHYGKEEIDIIAEHPDYIAIVEVKTRTSAIFGSPEESVSPAKRKRLIKAAESYVKTRQVEKDIYFDVISVLLEPDLQLTHIREAFYP